MNLLLNISGPHFLALYVVLFVMAIIAGRAIRAKLTAASHSLPRPKTWSPYELAYLSGGPKRAVATALVRLVRQGHLQAAPEGSEIHVATVPKQSTDPFERDVYLAVQNDPNFSDWRPSQKIFADIVGNLQQGGLISNPLDPAIKRARWWASLPLALLILLGIGKLWFGISHNHPVTFLLLLLAISLMTFLGGLANLAETTSARGQQLLKHFMQRNAALKTTALSRGQHLSEADLLLGVALFGAAVLAGTELSWLNDSSSLRDRTASDSSGSGDSSGGGGGGDGGGGSGGCGGCGGGGGCG